MDWRGAVGSLLWTLGELERDEKRYKQALEWYNKAETVLRNFKETGAYLGLVNDMAACLEDILKMERFDEAVPLLEQALAIYSKVFGENHERTIGAKKALSKARQMLVNAPLLTIEEVEDRIDKANQLFDTGDYRAALEAFRAVKQSSAKVMTGAMELKVENGMADCLHHLQDYKVALAHQQRGLVLTGDNLRQAVDEVCESVTCVG